MWFFFLLYIFYFFGDPRDLLEPENEGLQNIRI